MLRRLAFFGSSAFLLNRSILWMVFWANALGSIYGYEWYANQIEHTLTKMDAWLVWFVPDSPTATLFFTFGILALLLDGKKRNVLGPLRPFVEAFAVVTGIKYGIWAVAMNIATGMQGGDLDWQNYMLIASHAAMALQAMLYARYFSFRPTHVALVAAWTLTNDYMDYREYVYPWLADVLDDDLKEIGRFTVGLSFASIAFALLSWKRRRISV